MSEGNPSGKLFSGAKTLGKRVPKAAWYIAGGVVIAGGIFYLRNQDAAGTDSALDESGAVGYEDSGNGVPGVIVAPGPPGEAVSAEINTDIPVATLDLLGGVIADLADRIPSAEDLALLAGGGSGGVNPGNDPGGTVTAPATGGNAGTATKPKPNPCTKLEGGFHCGDTITDGNLHKKVSGAVGWKRDSSAGTGTNHWIKYRVRHCAKLEIWRVFPNKPGTPWDKTHSQAASNIC